MNRCPRTCYGVVLGAVAAERVAELAVANRNRRWAVQQGAVESGRGLYPWMVALHTGLLIGCAIEPVLADRRFRPAVGVPALTLAAAAQGLRWWCIRSLGRQWNTRVLVVPGAPLQDGGPYRWLRHPNYVAVVIEGLALPMIHSCTTTASLFTAANAAVLRSRIRTEEHALTAGLRPR